MKPPCFANTNTNANPEWRFLARRTYDKNLKLGTYENKKCNVFTHGR
jgi:hypothetical protein